MRSNQLRLALSDFVDDAARHLSSETGSGAEIPFEIVTQRARRQGTPMYAYRPLTDRFIASRAEGLTALPRYAPAHGVLAAADGVEDYLYARGATHAPPDARGRARAALLALLNDVFAEQSDFQLRQSRLQDALDRLEDTLGAGAPGFTVVATVSGLVLSSARVALTRGLTLATPGDVEGLPEELMEGSSTAPYALAFVWSDSAIATDSVHEARDVLRSLLLALRLYGDGRIGIGGLAWWRAGAGPWRALALGAEREAPPRGALVLRHEQEDELRGVVARVRRHALDEELAWALRRYEMGCERASEHEALSDYLLALRCLLEPEGPASGLLSTRLAVLCAEPENRAGLAGAAARAVDLERAIVRGAAAHGQDDALVRVIAEHLRALLLDVVSGLLAPDLYRVADEHLERPSSTQAYRAGDRSEERTMRLRVDGALPRRPRQATPVPRHAPAAAPAHAAAAAAAAPSTPQAAAAAPSAPHAAAAAPSAPHAAAGQSAATTVQP